ncbi:radical SAM protein [Xenorhabdus sp. Vera]|uniref:SPASM domain-containing protein n=1 Tax=Xenorhabdus koppenhoeferi TaxID=351659 RepID=UPI0019A81E48|nr:SPASM domain-containing protein [Xenorhabdus sp. Vera]MBD2809861.1 radical SAM protein [Xenorhabdus sp. Vera]
MPNLQSLIRNDLPGNFNEAYNLYKRKELILCNLNGIIVPPYEVLIHPSSYCNLTCQWCIGDHIHVESNEDMEPHYIPKKNEHILPNVLHSEKALMSVVENILSYKKKVSTVIDGVQIDRTFSVENFSFSGITGEPLIAKKALISAIRKVTSEGKRTGLFTNGLRISGDICDVLSRLSYINISVDAGSNETYNKLKCSSRASQLQELDKVFSNIYLLKQFKELNSTNLEINCSCILYPENFREIYSLAKKLKSLGVSNLRLKKDIYGEKVLSESERAECLKLVEKIRDDLEDSSFKLITVHDLNNLQEQMQDFSSCLISKMMAAVGSDGMLYPCNYHPKPNGHYIGNLVEKPLEEIWESRYRADIDKQLPVICPSVCDPFKTRSNRLFDKLNHKYKTSGPEQIHTFFIEAENLFGGRKQ